MITKKKLTIALTAIFFVVAVALGVHLMHKDALAVTWFTVYCTQWNTNPPIPLDDVADMWAIIYDANGNQIWGCELLNIGDGYYRWSVGIDLPPGAVWEAHYLDGYWIPIDPGTNPTPRIGVLEDAGNWMNWELLHCIR